MPRISSGYKAYVESGKADEDEASGKIKSTSTTPTPKPTTTTSTRSSSSRSTTSKSIPTTERQKFQDFQQQLQKDQKKEDTFVGPPAPSGVSSPVLTPAERPPPSAVESMLLKGQNKELGRILYEKRTGKELAPPPSGTKTMTVTESAYGSPNALEEVGKDEEPFVGPPAPAPSIPKTEYQKFQDFQQQLQKDKQPTSPPKPGDSDFVGPIQLQEEPTQQDFRRFISNVVPDSTKAQTVLDKVWNTQDMAKASGVTPETWNEIKSINQQNQENLEQANKNLQMVQTTDVDTWIVDGKEVPKGEVVNMLQSDINKIEEAIDAGKVKIGDNEYIPGQDSYGSFLTGFEKKYDEAVYESGTDPSGIKRYYEFVPYDTYNKIQRDMRLGKISEDEGNKLLSKINYENMATKPESQRKAWAKDWLQFENPEISKFRSDTSQLIGGAQGVVGLGVMGGGQKEVLKKLANELGVDASLVDKGQWNKLQNELVSAYEQRAIDEGGMEPLVGWDTYKEKNPAAELKFDEEKGQWNVDFDYVGAQRREMRNLWEENPLAAVGKGALDVITQYPRAVTTGAGYEYRKLQNLWEEDPWKAGGRMASYMFPTPPGMFEPEESKQPSYQEQLFEDVAEGSYGISQAMRAQDLGSYASKTVGLESPAMTDVYLPILGGAAFSAVTPTATAGAGRLGSWVTTKTGGKFVSKAGQFLAKHPGVTKGLMYGGGGGLVYGPTVGPAAWEEYVTGRGETGSTAEAAARSTLQLGGFLAGAGSTIPGTKGKKTFSEWGKQRADTYMTNRGYVKDPTTGKFVQDPYGIRKQPVEELEKVWKLRNQGLEPEKITTSYQKNLFNKGWEAYAKPKMFGSRFAKYQGSNIPKLPGSTTGTGVVEYQGTTPTQTPYQPTSTALVEYQPVPTASPYTYESGRMVRWSPLETDVATYNKIPTGSNALVPSNRWGSLAVDTGFRGGAKVPAKSLDIYGVDFPRQTTLGEYGLQIKGGGKPVSQEAWMKHARVTKTSPEEMFLKRGTVEIGPDVTVVPKDVVPEAEQIIARYQSIKKPTDEITQKYADELRKLTSYAKSGDLVVFDRENIPHYLRGMSDVNRKEIFGLATSDRGFDVYPLQEKMIVPKGTQKAKIEYVKDGKRQYYDIKGNDIIEYKQGANEISVTRRGKTETIKTSEQPWVLYKQSPIDKHEAYHLYKPEASELEVRLTESVDRPFRITDSWIAKSARRVRDGVDYGPPRTLAESKALSPKPETSVPTKTYQKKLWEYTDDFVHKPAYHPPSGESRSWIRGRPQRGRSPYDKPRLTEKGKLVEGKGRLDRGSRIKDLQAKRRSRFKKSKTPVEKPKPETSKWKGDEYYGTLGDKELVPYRLTKGGKLGKLFTKPKVKKGGTVTSDRPSGSAELIKPETKTEAVVKRTPKQLRKEFLIKNRFQAKRTKLLRVINKRAKFNTEKYSNAELKKIQKELLKEKKALENIKRMNKGERRLLDLDKKILKDIDNRLDVKSDVPSEDVYYSRPTIVKSRATGEPILVTGREGNMLYGESLYEVPGTVSNYWQGKAPVLSDKTRYQLGTSRRFRTHQLRAHDLLSKQRSEYLSSRGWKQGQSGLLAGKERSIGEGALVAPRTDLEKRLISGETTTEQDQTQVPISAQAQTQWQSVVPVVVPATSTDTALALDTATALDTDVVPLQKYAPYPPQQPVPTEPEPEPKPAKPSPFGFPKFPGGGSSAGGGGGRYYPQRRGYFERKYDVPDIWGQTKLTWGGKQARIGGKKPKTFSLVKRK